MCRLYEGTLGSRPDRREGYLDNYLEWKQLPYLQNIRAGHSFEPFSRCRHGGGCTDCQSDACRAWVRHRKTLVKETKDEEVSVIERKVKYVCCQCAATGKTGCCGGEPAEHGGWWPHWMRW